MSAAATFVTVFAPEILTFSPAVTAALALISNIPQVHNPKLVEPSLATFSALAIPAYASLSALVAAAVLGSVILHKVPFSIPAPSATVNLI
mgnify:CR=1 FL=1